MSHHPIAEYALLSDCHGSALVHRAGSVDWMCLPRFDSPAVFCRLLDEDGGHWSIRPTGEFEVERRYLDGTLVLETTFTTPGGELVLIDALALAPNEEAHGHDLGADAPHCLIRQVRCTRGEVEVEIEFQPRPEYGLIASLMRKVDGGVLARGGASAWMLSCDVDEDVEQALVRSKLCLRDGDCRRFALQYASILEPRPEALSQAEIETQLETTCSAWRHWQEMHQSYEGPWRDLVWHSGRILQALSYYPTGAVIAAATTSLPESVGGERNWDYRYTWVRDASFTLDALWVAACPDEAEKYIDFLANAAFTKIEHGHDMQIMYGIAGEHDLSERELGHLSGWRGSKPVRVGNGAWNQRQIDVYGELLAAVHRLREHLGEVDALTKRFLVEVADAAARCWRQPDQGIWEVRSEPRHYLYSKLMCWVALDRAIELADWLGAPNKVDAWSATREEICQEILNKGWNAQVGAFTQSFGDDALDAANLVIPMVDFLPADDERVLATIDAIEEHLTDEQGLVYRYRRPDGLEGEEGSFLLCTFWLAHARALAGQPGRAREIFERAASYANDLGLLAEEVDPASGELLGNFPQAFSHIGLVNAAWAIRCAEA